MSLLKRIALCLLLAGCATPKSKPRNLREAVAFFEQHWSSKDKEAFRKAPEETATLDLHFSTGMWIRNEWIHGKRAPELVRYFASLDIHHPDDMSSIILTSLHRKLNGKAIDLDEQVKSYLAYWKPIRECIEATRAAALVTYREFSLGDTITIRMPVDTTEGRRNAFLYDCPTPDWTFDEGKDLVLRGKIVEKYFINDTANVFFTVRVQFLNQKDVQVLMRDVKAGDTTKFSLKHLRVE